jgi:hypothetical protein
MYQELLEKYAHYLGIGFEGDYFQSILNSSLVDLGSCFQSPPMYIRNYAEVCAFYQVATIEIEWVFEQITNIFGDYNSAYSLSEIRLNKLGIEMPEEHLVWVVYYALCFSRGIYASPND